MTAITLAQAYVYLDAALTLATEENINVSVAVLDAGGHELAFARVENANLATIELAVKKARTAVYFKVSTRALSAPMSSDDRIPIAESTGGALVGIPGGVPILDADGTVVGAIGVSGGSSEQDDAIATTALG